MRRAAMLQNKVLVQRQGGGRRTFRVPGQTLRAVGSLRFHRP